MQFRQTGDKKFSFIPVPRELFAFSFESGEKVPPFSFLQLFDKDFETLFLITKVRGKVFALNAYFP